MERKIIVILGPTASGKTGMGVKIAKDFNGEIISADSRQVFRGLDIGSGKEGAPANSGKFEICRSRPHGAQTKNSKFENLQNAKRFVDGIPQWLIDIKNPGEDFNLFEFIDLSNLAIEDIFSRGKTPVVVGGTGLYIQGLVEGFKLKKMSNVKCLPRRQAGQMSNVDREQLNNLSIQQLRLILNKLDPEALSRVDQNNPHRLIRAIERAQNGFEMIKVKPDFKALQIGITWPREILNTRIEKRVDDRFDQGMLEEVAGLLKQGVDPDWLIKLGLEYREITKYILNNRSRLGQAQTDESRIMNQEKSFLSHPEFISSFDSTQLDLSKVERLGSRIKEIPKLVRNDIEYVEMSQTLKFRIRQFAKRQTTWFKRFPEIVWENDYKKIKKIVNNFISN